MTTRDVNVSLQLTRDRVLIRRLQRKLGASADLVAPDQQNESIPLGEIVAVGPGLERADGTLNPVGVFIEGEKTPLQPGDTVFYLHAGSVRLEVGGKLFFVVHEPQIVGLAHIEESRIVRP